MRRRGIIIIEISSDQFIKALNVDVSHMSEEDKLNKYGFC
jgi:hypothetical protein